jgi:DNA-directed RNA polymerase specialized sigma24 family protein
VRAFEVGQLWDCIQGAIGRLSQIHGDIFRLRHFCGLRHQQIADQLGRSIGYVGGTLARAERNLVEEIREACADHLGDFGILFELGPRL